jgi:hypothetical protein
MEEGWRYIDESYVETPLSLRIETSGEGDYKGKNHTYFRNLTLVMFHRQSL